jgi:hypothetical protein
MHLSLTGIRAGELLGGSGGSWIEGRTDTVASSTPDGHVLLAGSGPEQVARVELQRPDGSRIPMVTRRIDGYRMLFFGQWFKAAPQPTRLGLLVGYDAAGVEVLRHEVPW